MASFLMWLSGVGTGIVIMMGVDARNRYRESTRAKRERLAREKGL